MRGRHPGASRQQLCGRHIAALCTSTPPSISSTKFNIASLVCFSRLSKRYTDCFGAFFIDRERLLLRIVFGSPFILFLWTETLQHTTHNLCKLQEEVRVHSLEIITDGVCRDENRAPSILIIELPSLLNRAVSSRILDLANLG